MEQGSRAPSQRRINFTVAFVLLLFGFIYWTVVFSAVRARAREWSHARVTRSRPERVAAAQVLPWLEGSVHGVTHVGLFTLSTATALVMYLTSVFTDPGR